VIQITPQMRLLLAVEPVDFRKGIDGLVQVCRQRLNTDPIAGALFVFSNRRRRALKILICERALKMAILHRNNSLGCKTQNGARLGDMFMSLIHTCRLCATNPLEHLNALQNHAKKTLEHPTRWRPWNYEQALRPLDTS
jgi:hypothetical protein